MDGFPELTIGEVARRAGVAPSSIRYYERIGLLPEPDRLGGQRRYDADVLGKLGFIGVAQSAGFKLREIRELIDGIDRSHGWESRCARSRARSSRRSTHSWSAHER
jgi:DNA-binding transcriptional MerR regulator